MTTALTSRRLFTLGATALATIATPRFPAGAAEFECRCATNQTLDHPSTVRLTQMWKAIAEESGGRLSCKLFPNSQLGGDTATLSQVRVGALDFLLCGSGTVPTVVLSANIGFLGFAYKDAAQGLRVLDGPLGDYIRAEATTKGIHALHSVWDGGMLSISSSTRPIRTPDDLRGFKIRVAESRIAVDLFKTFGATPTPVSTGEVYTALQAHLIDGASTLLPTMESGRYFEVQRYLSLTYHQYGFFTMLVNGGLWSRFPPNLRESIERNNTKYAMMERRDVMLLNDSLADKLHRRGVAVNAVDQAPFRAMLKNYYTYWADVFGPKEWGLLETAIGQKLT